MRNIVGGLAAIASLVLAAPASARVVVGVEVGPYWGWPAPYPYPYPYVYAPPALVVAPAPAAVVAAQPQSWFYCDNPQGYYPYVATCAAGWRQVPAQQH